MTEKVMNTEKDPVKRGFGWKRIHQASGETKEERVLLKNILHDYQDLKHYCQFFETIAVKASHERCREAAA